MGSFTVSRTRIDLAAGVAGATATFVGLGLGRFAYTPLVPAMVDADWTSPVAAGYLGAANLLGYLIGALAADRIARRLGTLPALGLSFIAVVTSLLLCAWPLSLAWLSLWRLLAGVAGAVLMVVGGSTALTAVPASMRPRTAAMAFSGVGLGILAAAAGVPVLLHWGVSAAWLGLGAAGAFLALPVWPLWRRLAAVPAPGPAAGNAPSSRPAAVVGLVIAAYALDAAGFVPHTVYWVDFLARERALGLAAASLQWALFGMGAAAGALLAGEAARKAGWHASLVAALWLKSAAVLLPVFVYSPWLLAASSVLVGALVPGMVTLVSGRLAELGDAASHRRIWGRATAAFALAQAAGGYGYAALLDLGGGYPWLFGIAAAALAAGAAVAGLARPRALARCGEPTDGG